MPSRSLLIVHHSPSTTLSTMLERVVDGANANGLEAVEVVCRPALDTPIDEVLEADGYILGTPANLGYMSGALKHFFDTIYNACLGHTTGRPYGVYVHGQTDTDGALLAITRITTGLGWRICQEPVSSLGPLDEPTRDRCFELGAATAAGLL